MGAQHDTTDAELVARWLAQSSAADAALADAALSTIYRRHSDAVYRYARMIAASPEIAADAMQDSFIWFASEGAERFDATKGSIAALLCGVARNYVLRAHTGSARYVLASDDHELDALQDESALADGALPDAFATLDAREREATIREAIAELPHEFREAIVLVELESFSYEEAAAIVGCPIGTIRSRLNRAKARLRDALRELFALSEGTSS